VFRQVSIIAPGLLGASLGMACHARGLAGRVVVWARRAEARAACRSQAWCDEAPDTLAEAVKDAELIVLCPPVALIVPLIESIADSLAGDALLTDVGSTKSAICAAAQPVLPKGRYFVGAHPMAGSEKSGMHHARADLFEGRPCFVTPGVDSPEPAVARVERFWSAVGLQTVRETPERHDAIVAHVSHLPHFLASLLAVTLSREAPGAEAYSGLGLRDTTRVAAGCPKMWRDISAQNREALLGAIGDFRRTLDAFEGALKSEDFDQVQGLLEEGREFRLRLDAENP
jgi:cyclohexadieny/prephenate dehydrogenase